MLPDHSGLLSVPTSRNGQWTGPEEMQGIVAPPT